MAAPEPKGMTTPEIEHEMQRNLYKLRVLSRQRDELANRQRVLIGELTNRPDKTLTP